MPEKQLTQYYEYYDLCYGLIILWINYNYGYLEDDF